MADENGNGAGSAAEAAAERKPTERVILKAERAIVVPLGVDAEQIARAVEMLYPKGKRAERESAVVDAWVEVARATAATKRAAIVAHAGEPGTPDAKQGTFRAPTITSWKDGMVFEAPPLPLVQMSIVE